MPTRKFGGSTKKLWEKIFGFHIGQRIRIVFDCWYCGKKLRGRRGTIVNIGYDTSNSFRIYYVKVTWIKGEFQMIEGEFELE